MSILRNITKSDFLIRLKSWEYWPFGVLQFPVFFYFFWLAFRARSLVFFSGSNPGITMGGMFGESKHEILQKIPSTVRPKSILIQGHCGPAELLGKINQQALKYPLIFKPDIGERGFGVTKISNDHQAIEYASSFKRDFVVQEFVELPLEFGVFYRRFPNEKTGRVTSIVGKEMLYVVGDGTSTLQQLILNKERAKLQWNKLKRQYSDRLDEVLPPGKKLELVGIGNHALGTKFLDGSKYINSDLSAAFDNISQQIEGFYFGRFDLRCKSIEDLIAGNVMILELNGCGAEPAHIYEPGFSFFKALKILFIHWRNIYVIAMQNRNRGFVFTSLSEGMRHYRTFKNATR